jgi:hypothetical protein
LHGSFSMTWLTLKICLSGGIGGSQIIRTVCYVINMFLRIGNTYSVHVNLVPWFGIIFRFNSVERLFHRGESPFC